MHFRNGAVAISYVSTLLLKLVDEKKVSLDDKLSKWLPEIPHADRVTLGQLAQMTSGYVDYVIGNTEMNDALYANPFRRWTVHDLLQYATDQPLLYEPGTNWNYAHTNYVLLGPGAGEGHRPGDVEAVVRQGASASRADQHRQLDSPRRSRRPCCTRSARSAGRSSRSPPAHRSTRKRTFWDPSWTITHGAIQTTNIYDMEATAVGIGSGQLLTPDSYKKMVSTDLRGKTRKQPGCTTCDEMNDIYTYGLGHRHLRQLAAAEPADVRIRGARGLLTVAEDRNRRRRHLRARSVRRPGRLPQRRPTRCSARSVPSWPPKMRHPCLRRNNVAVAPKVLFIYNEHLATEALLGEAFTESGFDVETFEVVPAERVDDPGRRRDLPRPARLRRHRPARCAVAGLRRRPAPHLGGRRDAAGARRRRRGRGAARRVLRRPTARAGVRRFGRALGRPGDRLVRRRRATTPIWSPADRGSSGISTGGRCRRARRRSPAPRTRRRRSCSAARSRCSFTPRSTANLLELWLADDRDGEVVGVGLSHDELRSRTTELADSAAKRIRGLVRGFLTHVARQPCPSS